MEIKVIETVKNTEKNLIEKMINNELDTGNIKIVIDKTKEYQELIGFGGAFTEAASTTLDKMSPEKRTEILKAYFDPNSGINYSFCRTHINSCDFSLGNYAYAETPGDIGLKDFTIKRDKKSLIPMIKEAAEINNNKFKLFSSPWSPPAWMKTTGRMNNGGSLKKEFYEVWAEYFARYIKAYKKEEIDIWGVTIQNEPMAVSPWDNCVYSNEEERDFVKILGPTLKKEGLENIKIIVWDHNKDMMKDRVDCILSDENAAKWVWGVGFHWYGNDDVDSIMDNSVLSYTHEKYGKNLVFTEGCNPLSLYGKETLVGEWWTGEKYGRHIINDLNHYTRAWCDWNMVLDEKGGPNHVNNYCDAPIIVDTVNDNINYNSPFYYIAHFSKYIKEGYKRIGYQINKNELLLTAWKGNDEIVAVIMNEKEEINSYSIETNGNVVSTEIAPRSIQTVIIKE